jgi:hypothetical protein
MKEEQLLLDLTDEQCEKVVGGVGVQGDRFAGAGAGTQGWFGNTSGPPSNPDNHGLAGAGFTPGNIMSAGPNMIMVPGRKGD